jgi:hypothetical protein
MKSEILATLEYSKNLIISPDMDGFVSAQLLNRYNGSKVVGTYDKNILCLSDGVIGAYLAPGTPWYDASNSEIGIRAKDCLFVDCDINNSNYVSIGNHMRLQNDNMSSQSFNPNTHFGITNYSDKFPFATAYLIAYATGITTSATDMIRMAYADSTLRNMENYSDNMRTWSDRMNCPAVEYVIHNTDVAKEIDEGIRKQYPNQSFTSKRYGKDRYIQTLNDALVQEKISHETLTHGNKYLSDKVGFVTAKKYNNNIFSYAEIFSGEYSVTYYDVIEW